jgi:hypothetical protein
MRKTSTELYGMEQSHLSVQKEPASIEEATTSPERSEWTQAMEAEMKLLKDDDIWELVKIHVHVPAGKKGVGSRWVDKIKNGYDSTPECYKARLAILKGLHKNLEASMTRCLVP